MKSFKKIKIFLFSIAFVSLVILISGCKKNDYSVSPTSGSPGANEVWLQNVAYNPATKTVSVGTTITWTNKDNTTHTVTSGVPNAPDGIFNSGHLTNGGTFSFKFNTAGTFKYYCQIHGAMMTATMTVQ